MKSLSLSLLILCVFSVEAKNPYRVYLLSKISASRVKAKQVESCGSSGKINFTIARYETPKGNVCCRLEDKLIQTTKVWIRVGVK